MNIVVLSRKGGAGKTTIYTNLALALKANYVDCDVEEPNGFLFLKPRVDTEEKVMVEHPIIDDNKCTNCGETYDMNYEQDKDNCPSCGSEEVICSKKAELCKRWCRGNNVDDK